MSICFMCQDRNPSDSMFRNLQTYLSVKIKNSALKHWHFKENLSKMKLYSLEDRDKEKLFKQ